jgi:hypothetical protein
LFWPPIKADAAYLAVAHVLAGFPFVALSAQTLNICIIIRAAQIERANVVWHGSKGHLALGLAVPTQGLGG